MFCRSAFWQLNLFHLIIGGYIIDAGVARSLLKSMSKAGSEDGQQERKEVHATGQSPLPAYEGTAMKSGLGTSQKSFFIISPCHQVQHGGYSEPKKDTI